MSQYRISSNLLWWLAIAQFMALVPHYGRIPVWIYGILVLCAARRLMVAYGHWSMPNPVGVMLVVSGAVAVTLFHYHSIIELELAIALLSVAFSMKLLELRQRKDSLLIVFLGYFLVITHFFYAQSLVMGVYLVISFVVLTITLIGINRIGDTSPFFSTFKMSCLLLLLALPLTLTFYFIFPRPDAPFLSLNESPASASTGFARSMAPGAVSQLAKSNKIVFSVRFKSRTPKSADFYWRGITLNDFDGHIWKHNPYPEFNTVAPAQRERVVDYELELERTHEHVVFALDRPDLAPNGLLLLPDYQILSMSPIHTPTRYQLSSKLGQHQAKSLTEWEQQQYVQLPKQSNDESYVFAQQNLQKSTSSADYIQKILKYFREQPFFYTLEPPLLTGPIIDRFLFGTRQGFCEHYASAFTFLMRAANIPARIVLGYMGGEWNDVSKEWVVRQYHAHAWTEVWLEGNGWIRIDPTAAVAPSRVDTGVPEFVSESLTSSWQWAIPNWLSSYRNDNSVKTLLYGWQKLNQFWRRTVMEYSSNVQNNWFQQISTASYLKLAFSLVIIFVVVILMGTIVWLTLKMSSVNKYPLDEAYRAFCHKLAAAGLPRYPYEGPVDYLNRATQHFPQKHGQIKEIMETYVAMKYGKHSHPHQSLASLKHKISHLAIK